MTTKKSSTKKAGGKKESAPEDGEKVVTVERINELTDVIVPERGCEGNSSDVVALALAELIETLTNPETKYAAGEDGHWFAYFVVHRAFTKTGQFEDSLEDWKENLFESARRREAEAEEGGA